MAYFKNNIEKHGQYFNYHKHPHNPEFVPLTELDFILAENICNTLCSECEQALNCRVHDNVINVNNEWEWICC